MKKNTYYIALNIAQKLDDLFYGLANLNRINDETKIYRLLESMEAIMNNPCALKAWGIKAKKVIRGIA